MKISTVATAFYLVVFPAAAHAMDICEAVAVQTTTKTGDFPYALKYGETVDAVTQYTVSKKTRAASFCQHGGGCYPAEALRLVNCAVQSKPFSEYDDEVIYGLDVIRSRVSPTILKEYDAAAKLLELGLCYNCADNAAIVYVKMPSSICAKLVSEALEGNPAAIEKLKDDTTESCNASQVPGPPLEAPTEAGGIIAGFIVICLLLFFYFIPTVVAFSRKRYNAGAIFVLNLFLGWTLVFWVMSLVWAVSNSGERGR